MLNKKTVKMIFSVLICMMILATSISVFAITPSDLSGASNVTGTSEIGKLGNQLVGIFQTVGVVVAVVILLVLGVKYMMGSAEEKSEYKKSMMPYLVGAILIFAASTVTNIVYQFATGLNN